MAEIVSDMAAASKGKVFLTGGTGFIASHILDQLLDKGYSVVTTVRSASKGQRILDSLDAEKRPLVSYVLVDDFSKEGAFDEAIQCKPDYVIHTASPVIVQWEDPVRDVLDPAIRGTTSLLRSIQRFAADSVRRVVLTSSSAAILNRPPDAKVHDESCWRSVNWEQAQIPINTYEASKVFAERSAWQIVRGGDLETASETSLAPADFQPPPFTLAVINCTYTFGPVQRWLRRADSVNMTNQRLRDLVTGHWSTAGWQKPPTRPVYTWVDVRDVAKAHVEAMTVPEAENKRFYIVAGYYSNGQLASIVQAARSGRLAAQTDRIPPIEETADDLPADVFRFDNQRSRTILGLQYRSLEDSVLDTVESILAMKE